MRAGIFFRPLREPDYLYHDYFYHDSRIIVQRSVHTFKLKKTHDSMINFPVLINHMCGNYNFF